MSKELTKQETTTEVSTVSNQASEWGDVAISMHDLVLPKILIQQSLSAAVKSKVCQEGDLFNTLTEENLGTSIELLPFLVKESIIVEKWTGRKFEFHTVRKFDKLKESIPPFEEEIDGVRYKNSHQYEFLCLTKDLSIPHVLPFKGTSSSAGKRLFTLMYTLNSVMKMPPCGKWITYFGKVEVSKAGDSYYVSNIKESTKATAEETALCKHWCDIFANSEIKTAEEKQVESTPVESKRF